MKKRSLAVILRDLRSLGDGADRQMIASLAYQLRSLDWSSDGRATETELAMRRLLRDIVNKQAGDVRMANLQG